MIFFSYVQIGNFLTFSNIYLYIIHCKAPLSSGKWHYINSFIVIVIIIVTHTGMQT